MCHENRLGMCEPRPKNINDANHPNYDTYIYAWDGKTARSVGNTFPSINNELYSQLDNSSRTVSDETSCMVALAGLPAGATAWGARGEYAAAKAASKWLGRAVAGTGIGMAVMALSAAAYGGYCMIDQGTDEHGVKYENVPWNVIGPYDLCPSTTIKYNMGDNNKPISEKIDALPVSSTTCEGRDPNGPKNFKPSDNWREAFLTYPNETQENTPRHKRPPRSKRRRYGR